jgi:3-oxoacyl-[acyl-carrier protein] reductase
MDLGLANRTALVGGASKGLGLAIPLGRFGEPRELGDVVTSCARAAASYLTGITVPVEGGQSRGLT